MAKIRKRLVKYREDEATKKKQKRKNARKGDDYKPFEDGPTVGEAKELLMRRKLEKGIHVESIKYYPTKEYFLINYGLSKDKFFASGNPMGNGPYGLEKSKHDWSVVMWLYRRENGE